MVEGQLEIHHASTSTTSQQIH